MPPGSQIRCLTTYRTMSTGMSNWQRNQFGSLGNLEIQKKRHYFCIICIDRQCRMMIIHREVTTTTTTNKGEKRWNGNPNIHRNTRKTFASPSAGGAADMTCMSYIPTTALCMSQKASAPSAVVPTTSPHSTSDHHHHQGRMT